MESFETAFPKLFRLCMSQEAIVVLVIATLLGAACIFALRCPKVLIARMLLLEDVAYILYVTINVRSGGHVRVLDMDVLAKYWQAWIVRYPEAMYDILMNVVLFAPLGFLMRMCGIRWRVSFCIGLLLSICIELTQYTFCLGKCELADVLHNFTGMALGYVLCCIWNHLFKQIKA